MEIFGKIFMLFVLLGTYFLCAFSTDLLWLGQTGVAFLVFGIAVSILNEIIDDYLAKDRWKISWISLTLAFVFSFIFYFYWEQKITTYIFGALTLITFLVWITKAYQIKINLDSNISNAKKTPPIKKAPTAKTKPAIKKVPASRKIKLNSYKKYNQTQKDILLRTYSSLSKQQKISIICLFFSILKEEKPTKSDFEKIERELDLFNFKIDLLSGYNGWDGIVKDLNPLPTSLKEFIFISSMEFMFVDGKLSQKRMSQAEKVFSRIGISSDKAMEILGKHKALGNYFGF